MKACRSEVVHMKDWTGNKNSVYTALGASNHTEDEREQDDFYATDPIAIDLLLKAEKPSLYIWECACGAGHLTNRLADFGYRVYSSDIKDRDFPFVAIKDFLKTTDLPFSFDECDIVTNPPYKYAKEFVLKALDLLKEGHRCYMFLKLTFLEGIDRFRELFSKFPPKTVYVFPKRVLCAKNGDFNGMKERGGSAVAYAWFVWEKGYTGKPTIDWLFEGEV